MHQQRVLIKFSKYLPHLRKAFCELPPPARAHKIVAVRYERAPHPGESARPPVLSAVHHPITHFDLKRRLPIKDGGLRRPAETMLGLAKIDRRIKLAEKLTIPA
jgi:hypothetical protein